METTLAVLADHASNTQDGRVNLLGIFSRLTPQQVPLLHPLFFIVAMFRATSGEKGTHHVVRLLLVDDDGNTVAAPPDMPLVVPDVPGPDVEFHITLSMAGLVFSHYGSYRVDITVDGTSVAQLPLRIAQPTV